MTNEWTTQPTSAEGRMKWETKQVRVQAGVSDDQLNLTEFLDEGWEPFAVTGVRGDYTYHLKRKLYMSSHSIGRDLPDAM